MPLTHKGSEIEHNMEKEYGEKKGKEVFYASKNKGTIKGVEDKKKKVASKMRANPKGMAEKNARSMMEVDEHNSSWNGKRYTK